LGRITVFTLFILLVLVAIYRHWSSDQGERAHIQRAVIQPEQQRALRPKRKPSPTKVELGSITKPLEKGKQQDPQVAARGDNPKGYANIYVRAEIAWKKRVKRLLVNEMHLDPGIYRSYQELQREYNEDKMVALDELHEYMQEEYGSGQLPAEDKELLTEVLHDEYMEELKWVIGVDNYGRYVELKHQFNQDLVNENPHLDESLFMIDF
jgi:hypothetical protein